MSPEVVAGVEAAEVVLAQQDLLRASRIIHRSVLVDNLVQEFFVQADVIPLLESVSRVRLRLRRAVVIQANPIVQDLPVIGIRKRVRWVLGLEGIWVVHMIRVLTGTFVATEFLVVVQGSLVPTANVSYHLAQVTMVVVRVEKPVAMDTPAQVVLVREILTLRIAAEMSI